MHALRSFGAGFLSTLSFHQGMLAILHTTGLVAAAPYAMMPTWPFHTPAVVSLAFWGGVWAVVLSRLIGESVSGSTYWTAWVGLGALLPSLVAWFVVLPLKWGFAAGGVSPGFIVGSLLLNGAWGLGAALLLRGLEEVHADIKDESPRANFQGYGVGQVRCATTHQETCPWTKSTRSSRQPRPPPAAATDTRKPATAR